MKKAKNNNLTLHKETNKEMITISNIKVRDHLLHQMNINNKAISQTIIKMNNTKIIMVKVAGRMKKRKRVGIILGNRKMMENKVRNRNIKMVLKVNVRRMINMTP